jgi:hypothetical protein
MPLSYILGRKKELEMKVKKMVASVLAAGMLFCIQQNDTEAVKQVASNQYGSILVDEKSIFWQNEREFNALIYQMSPNNEVLKRGIYTFEYLKEYKNWYYHPLNDSVQYIRVDVDRLEEVPVIAMEEKRNKNTNRRN